jgi:hypothetical protein
MEYRNGIISFCYSTIKKPFLWEQKGFSLASSTCKQIHFNLDIPIIKIQQSHDNSKILLLNKL